MYDTYTDIPTIFEIKIRETGWIHDVYICINGCKIAANWIRHIETTDENYSIFRAEYIFHNVLYNGEATFYYSIGGTKYSCEPIKFNVYPFYD